MSYFQTSSFECTIWFCPLPAAGVSLLMWRWQTAHSVSTAGRIWEGRGLFEARGSPSVFAATPSFAPTPAPSAADPSLWRQRCVLHDKLGLKRFWGEQHPLPSVHRQRSSEGSSLFHQELSHKGRSWHEECFRCTKCYKPLAKEPFNTKDDRIMCVKCCSREDAPRCHGCYKSIPAGTTRTRKAQLWYNYKKCTALINFWPNG